MRRKLSALVGALVLLGSAACGSSNVNALEGKSPGAVLSAALQAATRLGGVHYVLQTSGTAQSQTVTGDAVTNEGAESVVTGSDQAVVELVRSTVFLRGNAGGLQDIIGLTATMASQNAGKWISFQPTDSLYQSVAHAVTLKSVLAELTPSGSLAESTRGRIAGKSVVGIRGALPDATNRGTATFWVATTAPTVPVGVDAQTTSGGQSVLEFGVFSRWGERFQFTAPSGALPFSALSAK